MTPSSPWPEPAAERIDYLSFSAWSRIHACLLRAAFSLDPSTKQLNRGRPASAVGNARHRLSELVSKGQKSGRPSPSVAWVKAQFNQLLIDERSRLQVQWSPAEVPPLRTWPDAALTRATLGQELGTPTGAEWPHFDQLEPNAAPMPSQHLTALAVRMPTPVMPAPGDAAFEVVLRDGQRRLSGKVDRLENRSGTLVVVDLKLGVGSPPKQLLDRHRAQMLFYAGLVHANFGVWPRLELVPVGGARIHVPYQASEVEAMRAEAVADRATLNESLARGNVAASVHAAPEKCAWCPFQVVCPALLREWDRLTTPDNDPLHRAVSLVRGVIREVRSGRASTDVVISQQRSLTAPAGEVLITRLPASLLAAVGSEFAVSLVAPVGSGKVIRSQWDTLFWPTSLHNRADITPPTGRGTGR